MLFKTGEYNSFKLLIQPPKRANLLISHQRGVPAKGGIATLAQPECNSFKARLINHFQKTFICLMSYIYSLYTSPQYQAANLLTSHQRGVPAKGGLSPHLHSNTRVQKYRHICCSKLENIILSNCQPVN